MSREIRVSSAPLPLRSFRGYGSLPWPVPNDSYKDPFVGRRSGDPDARISRPCGIASCDRSFDATVRRPSTRSGRLRERARRGRAHFDVGSRGGERRDRESFDYQPRFSIFHPIRKAIRTSRARAPRLPEESERRERRFPTRRIPHPSSRGDVQPYLISPLFRRFLLRGKKAKAKKEPRCVRRPRVKPPISPDANQVSYDVATHSLRSDAFISCGCVPLDPFLETASSRRNHLSIRTRGVSVRNVPLGIDSDRIRRRTRALSRLPIARGTRRLDGRFPSDRFFHSPLLSRFTRRSARVRRSARRTAKASAQRNGFEPRPLFRASKTDAFSTKSFPAGKRRRIRRLRLRSSFFALLVRAFCHPKELSFLPPWT